MYIHHIFKKYLTVLFTPVYLFKQGYLSVEWDIDFIVKVKSTTLWLDRGWSFFHLYAPDFQKSTFYALIIFQARVLSTKYGAIYFNNEVSVIFQS